MTDFAWLALKRNRGYPWPEVSFGLTPMFGTDGWCHSCGVPRAEQTGSLVMQRKRASRYDGAWVPNWLFDAFCLEQSVADGVLHQFDLQLREVRWHGPGDNEASQIVAPTASEPWFDRKELLARAAVAHGSSGETCVECGVWRWFPLGYGSLPTVELGAADAGRAVLASSEWFGGGLKAFRQILFARPLADAIARSSPKDFTVTEADVRIKADGGDWRPRS